MSHPPPLPIPLRALRLPAIVLISSLAVVTGCRDSSVASYRIPKEKDAPHNDGAMPAHASSAPMSGDMAGGTVAAAQGADLVWTAPAHWKTKAASSMRKGSFIVDDGAGAVADLGITAFPGDVGGDLANVNRWRGQLQLEPITAPDLGSQISRIENPDLTVSLVDLVNGEQRMLAAFVPFNGATWFFKLTGPTALLGKEKDAFVAFLKSVRPAPTPVAAETATPASSNAGNMADTEVIKADGPGLKWTAPTHWQAKPASAMRKASYAVNGADGRTADLSITAFPGDVGGELANVNRWRGQLALPPIAATELDTAVTRREVNGLHLTIVDLAGGAADARQRLLGAIVPFEGATWFIKLTGPDALVAAESPVFQSFLNTLQKP